MRDTHCPYCGASESHWNGATADAEWQDLMNKQDDEIAALKAERDRLRTALEKALGAMPGSADWHEARRVLDGEK